jgi:hypothetical protein
MHVLVNVFAASNVAQALIMIGIESTALQVQESATSLETAMLVNGSHI